MINEHEIIETMQMFNSQHLDIRTITMGISLMDCAAPTVEESCNRIYDKICRLAGSLVRTADEIGEKYGIPIVNKRVNVTPVAMLAGISGGDPVKYAAALDRAAHEIGVDFIGGYSALVQKGFSAGDRELIDSIPPRNTFILQLL